jgi:hypothetical protein
MSAAPLPFVPAQAGTQNPNVGRAALLWVPAFAGTNG